LDRKGNIFLPVGRYLYKHLYKSLNISDTKKRLRVTHVCAEDELSRLCEDYYVRLFSQLVMVCSIFFALGMLLIIKSVVQRNVIILDRNSYGENDKTYELVAGKEDDEWDISVEVTPKSYISEEMNEVFENGFSYIDEVYLGTNDSPDNITSNLNLVDEIKSLGLDVNWISDNYSCINSSGKITNQQLEEPVIVNLRACLSYGDYSMERDYPVRLVGRTYSEEELAAQAVQEYVDELTAGNMSSDTVELPDNISGYSIKEKGRLNGVFITFLLGLAAAVLFVVKSKSDLKEAEKIRNEALLQEYPGFVDRLTLYMGAGMTVKGALNKISRDRIGSKADQYNILSEELKYTLNEIESGENEADCYYRLGHRINLSVYLKVTSLLSQNIKKGTKDLLTMLTEEEQAALLMKRELARKKGETAGTKLLAPMIMLLAAVMLIVMLPALMSF
jgi:hypothetical protein